MIKAIFYKEWIKLRIPMLFIAIGATAVLAFMFLSIYADARKEDLPLTWLKASFLKPLYFEAVIYIFPIMGCLLALFQYVPEIVENRIKLSFHLPEHELRTTFYHTLFAVGFYIAVALYVVLVFIWFNSIIFPWQITFIAIKFLAVYIIMGLIAYFLISAIIIEKVLKYRVLYGITVAIVFYMFFTRNLLSVDVWVFLQYKMMLICAVAFLVFSAIRFYKGQIK